LGCPVLCHLGRDAWCLRSSVADLRKYGQKAGVPAHRLFLHSTSPLVGAGCRFIAVTWVVSLRIHARTMRHAFMGFRSPSMLCGKAIGIPISRSGVLANGAIFRPHLPCIMVPRPRCLAISFASPDQRVATRPRQMSPSGQLSQSISLLRHVQGSSVARTPSSRLTLLPAGLIPSQRHPWGFSLQRIDFILSRTPFGLPCPSVPWLVASSHRCRRALRQFGSWSDDSPGFKPAAPGCHTSPVPASRAEPLARHPRRSFCEDRF